MVRGVIFVGRCRMWSFGDAVKNGVFSVCVLCFWVGLLVSAAAQDELQQLRYNHAGLEVDLGVGLWAWPLPMDADSDGDLDLVVSCPDKPSNGLWFFEDRKSTRLNSSH